MDNEEIQGVKFSEFPSVTPESSDEVVGLHSGGNARFSIANIILLIRQGLANIFVPNTRKVNNHALSSDISLTASDVGARSSSWTPSASDVGAVPTTAVGSADGVASLGNDGKVPSSQLDLSGMQNTITASGILKGDGAGGVSAAVAGTDYGTYSKPNGGIPSSDMASAVQTSIGKADTAYQKPSAGIPSTDMTSSVQTSLGKADSAYQKPTSGIPAIDLASGVIPTVPSAYTSNPAMDGTASPGSSGAWAKGDHVHPSDTTKANQSQLAPVENGTTASLTYAAGEYFCRNGKTCRAKTAIQSGATLTLNTNYKEESSGGLNALNSTMSHVAKVVVISNVEGKTIPAGSSFVSFTPPTGLPHNNLLSLSLYCIYANVYFQWCPQSLNSRFVDANAMWNFNVNNLRGAAVTISDFLCIAIYNED